MIVLNNIIFNILLLICNITGKTGFCNLYLE